MQEKKPWGSTYFESIEDRLSFKTDKAQIDLITNPHFGRMLFIDGILQSATADEHIYHNSITSLAHKFLYSKSSNMGLSYLIAGGAEGAVVRELLHYLPKNIVMVDWDKELVDHMKSEEWAKDAFNAPCLSLLHDDIFEYTKNTNMKFDSIILDLLDPISEEDIDWLCELINSVKKCLLKGGVIVANAGGNKKIASLISDRLRKYAPIIECINVPSFQEPWYLLHLQG